MTTKALVPVKYALQKASKIVPYITKDEMRVLVSSVQGRKADRDILLLKVLFQTGLRISEALAIKPRDFGSHKGRAIIHVIGKGKKLRMVSCPDNLANRIKAYAFDHKLGPDDHIFPINRQRAWQIVKAAADAADINKKIWPHLFRHSDAIERLRQTRNPKALQLHLGHNTMMMTMKYLNTLTAEDAVEIQGEVEFDD